MIVKPRVNRAAVDLGAWRTAAFISSTPAMMPGPSPLSWETTMVDMPWLALTRVLLPFSASERAYASRARSPRAIKAGMSGGPVIHGTLQRHVGMAQCLPQSGVVARLRDGVLEHVSRAASRPRISLAVLELETVGLARTSLSRLEAARAAAVTMHKVARNRTDLRMAGSQCGLTRPQVGRPGCVRATGFDRTRKDRG